MRLAALAGLLLPGLLVDALDALAFVSYEKDVEIGQKIQLNAMYTLKLDCSGCEHSHDENDIPVYIDVWFTPEGDKPVRMTVLSNATFVPPATGRLHDAEVNLSEIPLEVHEKAKQRGCSITGGKLRGDPFPRN